MSNTKLLLESRGVKALHQEENAFLLSGPGWLSRVKELINSISRQEVIWQEADNSVLLPLDLRSIDFSTFMSSERQGHSNFQFSRPEATGKGNLPYKTTFFNLLFPARPKDWRICEWETFSWDYNGWSAIPKVCIELCSSTQESMLKSKQRGWHYFNFIFIFQVFFFNNVKVSYSF